MLALSLNATTQRCRVVCRGCWASTVIHSLRIWHDCRSAWAAWVCGVRFAPAQPHTGQVGADSLPMIQKRHPAVARLIVAQLSDRAEGRHLSGVSVRRERLAVEDCFFRHGFVPHLSDTQLAMIRSQSGPMAGVPLLAFPTSPLFRFDASAFRALLLRRLWRPSSLCRLSACRCGRPLDAFGHHPVDLRWVAGVLLWRVRRLVSTGKQVAGSPSTSESVTWTCLRGVHRIRGDLKWSRTGCLCSMGLNSRLTPP